jgi:hypothetical protein
MVDQKLVMGIFDELLKKGESNPTNLNELETLAEQLTRKLGRQILQKWLEALEQPDPPPSSKCRACGKDTNFVSKRAGFLHTDFGLVRYMRAYYVCPHCYQSTCPLDERLNPYESLARLRRQIAAGKSLPVDELASTWGLGSLNGFPQDNGNSGQNHFSDTYQAGPGSDKVFPIHSTDRSIPRYQEPILTGS